MADLKYTIGMALMVLAIVFAAKYAADRVDAEVYRWAERGVIPR